ncbi:hypothetical protein [Consotaella salsifontis]|uniref:Uncharacterized protein n=1 Tax=Consotaella salsifontis TaxID=1365950 RepID=A0A1T4P2E7_9HYPH|nr:hypothetical protein [Consotaella salsifontis]SJZ85649.1 hypothetical protein SAMN05428963_103303 [Consotaella salsifontis]
MILKRLAVLTLAAAAAASSVPAARAADLLVAPVAIGPCGDGDVLADVEDQFEYGAPRTLGSQLQIVEFSNLRERGYLPRTETSPIERHYCQGQALMSDGRYHMVYYVIEDPMGFASMGRRAEGCVLGLDPWHVYGANCQSLRRF